MTEQAELTISEKLNAGETVILRNEQSISQHELLQRDYPVEDRVREQLMVQTSRKLVGLNVTAQFVWSQEFYDMDTGESIDRTDFPQLLQSRIALRLILTVKVKA